jgi:hypothetical protein
MWPASLSGGLQSEGPTAVARVPGLLFLLAPKSPVDPLLSSPSTRCRAPKPAVRHRLFRIWERGNRQVGLGGGTPALMWPTRDFQCQSVRRRPLRRPHRLCSRLCPSVGLSSVRLQRKYGGGGGGGGQAWQRAAGLCFFSPILSPLPFPFLQPTNSARPYRPLPFA